MIGLTESERRGGVPAANKPERRSGTPPTTGVPAAALVHTLLRVIANARAINSATDQPARRP
jgi:hypothetical protein